MGNRNQRVASSFLLVSSLLAVGGLLMLGCPAAVPYYGLVAALSGLSTCRPHLRRRRRAHGTCRLFMVLSAPAFLTWVGILGVGGC